FPQPARREREERGMLRKPLGRGLDALLENTKPQAAGEAAAVLMTVAVERIVAGPFQPRRSFDPDRLQELTRAIEAHGVVEPLIVRRAPAAADGGTRYE